MRMNPDDRYVIILMLDLTRSETLNATEFYGNYVRLDLSCLGHIVVDQYYQRSTG